MRPFLFGKNRKGSTAAMDGHGIALVIGAVGGSSGAFLVSWLTQRRKGKRLDSDLMQDNFQTLYVELRQEISRIRQEQSEERMQWADERKELYKKLDSQTALMHTKDIEIIELKAKVSVMEVQLKSYEDRNNTPTKQVTIKT